MKLTRILAAVFAALLMCGCSKAPAPSVTVVFPEPQPITVWVPEGHIDLMTQMCKGFTDLHPDERYAILLSEVPSSDISADDFRSEDAPDVVFISSEQLPSLAAAGMLSAADKSKVSCNGHALSGASWSGSLYAYPCACNTCILYYDRSLLSEKQLGTLGSILEAKHGPDVRSLAIDLDQSGFDCAVFLGAGCQAAQPQTLSSERGQLAAELLDTLIAERLISDDHDIKSGFARRELAAAIADADSADAISLSLGKDFGAARLPLVPLSDGSEICPAPIARYLLIAVRSDSTAPAAHELAQWLVNGDNQLLRLQQLGLIPTDSKLCSDEKLLQQYPAVKAVHEQLSDSRILSQKQHDALTAAFSQLYQTDYSQQ